MGELADTRDSGSLGDHPALSAAGWFPGRDAYPALSLRLLEIASLPPSDDGRRWEVFAAAEESLREFFGLHIAPRGPGVDVAPTGVTVDPALAQHMMRAFGRLGDALGSRLFPLGRSDAGTYLAVDERGRLFGADHGGRWLYGDTTRAGLVALVEGRAPTQLKPLSWSWTLPRAQQYEVTTDLIRHLLVAISLLHRHGVLSAREISVRLTSLRGIGPAVFHETFALHHASLEENADLVAADVRERLRDAGVAQHGVETEVSLVPPPELTAPHSSVRCSFRAGAAGAWGKSSVNLSANVGFGAFLGKEALPIAAKALDRYVGSVGGDSSS